MTNIPVKEDWGQYGKDLDQKSVYASFFGQSNEQMQVQFHRNGNDLISELRFMPNIPFGYYILGFRDFIVAGDFPEYEASDFTSYFLDMVEYLLLNNPSLILSSMPQLVPALKVVANNQEKYDAPSDIYGDYKDKFANIIRLYETIKE